MSNSLAIAAVTTALGRLLETGLNVDLPGTRVTTKSPDIARDGNGNQVNLFLYQTTMNASLRNMDMPGQVRPGETGLPPLALDLQFLITVYGADDDDAAPFSHRLLGRAMRILHDHPLLGADEISDAVPEEIERVRITPLPLSVDELSKLWNTFQTGYRLSAAYNASVVLIESARRTVTPLPVLQRGSGNQGISAQSDLVPPFPALSAVQPPNGQLSIRLGEELMLTGHHLSGDSPVTVRFTSTRLDEPHVRPASASATDNTVSVQIPDEPTQWPAGFYKVSVVISRAEEPDRTTNELPLAIAPRIVGIAPDPAPRDGTGEVTLAITCSPEVRPGQRAALLLGNREVLAEDHPTRTDALDFVVADAEPGAHYVRLRVDGIDSLLVDRSGALPVFDSTQRVNIT